MEEKDKGKVEMQQGEAETSQMKKWPDHFHRNRLIPRLPQGMNITDVQDGLMIDWVL